MVSWRVFRFAILVNHGEQLINDASEFLSVDGLTAVVIVGDEKDINEEFKLPKGGFGSDL